MVFRREERKALIFLRLVGLEMWMGIEMVSLVFGVGTLIFLGCIWWDYLGLMRGIELAIR